MLLTFDLLFNEQQSNMDSPILYKSMTVYNFTVLIEQDEDGMLIAKVPDLPGCHTQAKNMDELMKRVKEAILLSLEVQKKDNKRVVQLKFIGVQQVEINIP